MSKIAPFPLSRIRCGIKNHHRKALIVLHPIFFHGNKEKEKNYRELLHLLKKHKDAAILSGSAEIVDDLTDMMNEAAFYVLECERK